MAAELARPPSDAVETLTSRLLAGAAHGFLGRRGGVSLGLVQGLDMGTRAMDEDDPRLAPVAENRRRGIAAVLPGARLVTVYQVHSGDCVIAGDWNEAGRPHADALVTDRPGLLLGILTADCAPVLFHDASAGVVGAAHAGWRGALAGVTDATLVQMELLGADRGRTAAVIGPCIHQASYEVDHGFRGQFLAAGPDNERWFVPGRAERWQFDLPGYVAQRLREAGVAEVEVLDQDTYAQEGRFFSHRRATHRGEPDYGRQISLIGLAA